MARNQRLRSSVRGIAMALWVWLALAAIFNRDGINWLVLGFYTVIGIGVLARAREDRRGETS